jgi:outer membrane lipoprotein-sorting protein
VIGLTGAKPRLRRALCAGLAGVLALSFTAAASAAVRDPVPLPHLRPGGSGTGPAAPAGAVPVAMPARPAPAAPGKPATQAELLARISAYFNSFRTMQGEFVQTGPRGEQSEGVFFLARPGKIRFHYRPPVRLDVIADGKTVAVQDMKAMTQDLYPLSKTPLRYLLAEQIDFSTLVQDVRQDRDLVSLVIVQKSAFADGQLTLTFDTRTYELKQWIVTDAQGLNTTVAIFNTSTDKPQDPNLFRINLMQR